MTLLGVVPECLECGACCHSRLDRYVRVTGDDYARLGEEAETQTSWFGNACFMAMAEEHCAALVVVPATGQFVCSVYGQRPETCRALERGSPECAAEREAKFARTRSSAKGA